MLNPSKYVRKQLFDLINPVYPCFDMQVTGPQNPTEYVIISTQSKEIDKSTKCGYRWISYTLLDIVTIYNGAGNPGSRLKVDDIENEIFQIIENITIPGYEVVNRRFEFPDTLENISTTQNVFRNFIRVILELK